LPDDCALRVYARAFWLRARRLAEDLLGVDLKRKFAAGPSRPGGEIASLRTGD
jgi:hypothetical protein